MVTMAMMRTRGETARLVEVRRLARGEGNQQCEGQVGKGGRDGRERGKSRIGQSPSSCAPKLSLCGGRSKGGDDRRAAAMGVQVRGAATRRQDLGLSLRMGMSRAAAETWQQRANQYAWPGGGCAF